MRFQDIVHNIERAMVDQEFPSVAVAVAKDGEILWEEGFGWANRERRIPATADTMYCLGSISKPITTTALMILVERGLISLDDPANEFLGDAKLTARVGRAEDATVRRLTNHTAGLPMHYHYFYEDEPVGPPFVDEAIRRYGNLVTAPGERYHYANLGYGILGHVIERVSGKTYADFLREEVFVPLGLSRASVWVPPEFEPYTAREYGGDNVAYPRKVTDHPGSGAVYASAHDLVRFGMFHLKQRQPDQYRILSDSTIDAMQVAASDSEGYGIGWAIVPDMLGYRMVGHEGGTAGAITQLLLFPTEGIAVAVLTNTSRHDVYAPAGITGDILGTLLPEFGRQLAELRTQREAEPAADVAPPFTPPGGLMGRWEGSIHTDQQDIPLALLFSESGEASAVLDGQKVLVAGVAMSSDYLTGTVPTTLATPDASRRPHQLSLDLKLRGDSLTGAVLAMTPQGDGEDGGAPGQRLGFALAHWTELGRQ